MTKDVNSVVLIGRLVKDAETKRFPDGSPVVNFVLAVNYLVKENDAWTDKADFLDVSASFDGVEKIAVYLIKGKRIAVVGRLKQEVWNDAHTGERRSKIKVSAHTVQFLDTTAKG